MTKIYVVQGNTGEYEDSYNWEAKIFFDKEKAEDLNKSLNTLVDGSRKLKYEEREKLENLIRETLDPNCSIDYTGTYYIIRELEVE